MTQKITQPGLQDPFKDRGFKSIKQSVNTSLNEVRTGMLGKRRVYPTKWERLNKNIIFALYIQIIITNSFILTAYEN